MEFKSDYYYGNEAEQYTFYRIPKALFTEASFKEMSNDARVLYGLMLDRMGLSVKNNWRDADNRIYIYFTLEDIQEYMNCSHTKGVKIISELEKINLIERMRQGQGKPTRIYIKKFIANSLEGKEDCCQNQLAESQDFQKREVKTSRNGKSRLPEMRSQDFQKREVKTSRNEKSRLPEMRSQDFQKIDSNNKENNNKKNNNKKLYSSDEEYNQKGKPFCRCVKTVKNEFGDAEPAQSNTLTESVSVKRQRYNAEQLKVIDSFFDVLKYTRRGGRIADGVELKIYSEWEKYETQKVIYGLSVYIDNPALHDKKENYALGIIRNLTSAEISGKEEKRGVSGKSNKFINYEQRNWDFDTLNKLKAEALDRDTGAFALLNDEREDNL